MILTPMAIADVRTTHAPTCSKPFQEAYITVGTSPTYPASAPQIPVTVLVQVTIGPTGKLIAAHIYQSSNNARMDMTALRAARDYKYAPKIVNCVPTIGSYIYRAEFIPQGPIPIPRNSP
ncbi:MAG: TonB family protein [Candidatus Aquilonibacter sp.]